MVTRVFVIVKDDLNSTDAERVCNPKRQ